MNKYVGSLRAGFSKVDVTPTEPVMLAGYDLREAASDGVHEGDRLFVRALVLDDGAARMALIESDVIVIRDADGFRRRVSDRTGIPFEHVIIADVHNHAAPSPDAAGETAWDRDFGTAVEGAVVTAIQALAPARLSAASGRSRVAMNRRLVTPSDDWSTLTFDENYRSQSFGVAATDEPVQLFWPASVIRLGANHAGPIDDEVQLVRVDGTDGTPIALLIHYACHGTSLGGRNSKVSGDWMGRMLATVEEQLPGVGTMFVQGAAGDINPRVVGGLEGYVDNIDVTHALGEEIAAEVLRVYARMEDGPRRDDSQGRERIEVASRVIQLPRAYRELFEDFTATTVPVTTTAARVGGVMWVTFPGEMFHAIGKRVKTACPAAVGHVIGYANGYIGYFPEQSAFAEGGYEPAASHLDPVAERTYLRELGGLLRGFH